MYTFSTLTYNPELAECYSHRWRPLGQVLNDINVIDTYPYGDAEGRKRSRRHLDYVYADKFFEPLFHHKQRFPPFQAMVDISLVQYTTLIDNIYRILGHETLSSERCAQLTQVFRVYIEELRSLVKRKFGVFTRERFESYFCLQWTE